MNLKTADLCDACDDAQACVLPFRSHGQRRAFAGRIRTVRAGQDVSRIRDLVAEPGHDQVLVVDGSGSLARALLGDVLAGMAQRNGWAGFVIHEAIRDAVELDAMDIGVKALGTAPRLGTGEVDATLRFGGVDFVPARRLVADVDGVIVSPPGLSASDIPVENALTAHRAASGAVR